VARGGWEGGGAKVSSAVSLSAAAYLRLCCNVNETRLDVHGRLSWPLTQRR
jgi:hypothetical protein